MIDPSLYGLPLGTNYYIMIKETSEADYGLDHSYNVQLILSTPTDASSEPNGNRDFESCTSEESGYGCYNWSTIQSLSTELTTRLDNLMIASRADQDWYKFTASSTATATLKVLNSVTSSPVDYSLRLFDLNGTEIPFVNGSCSATSSGNRCYNSIAGLTNIQANYNLTLNSTYYILVEDYQDNDWDFASTYSIEISY